MKCPSCAKTLNFYSATGIYKCWHKTCYEFGSMFTYNMVIKQMVKENSVVQESRAGSILRSRLKWDIRFLKLAEHIATWSKDPSSGVGAVIAIDKKVISHGFNGFPSGVKDNVDYLYDRKEKYPRVMHAEKNAILFAQRDLTGYTLYCTHFPCAQCTGMIIQSGISRIVCYKPNDDHLSRWGDEMEVSLEMCSDAKVNIEQYKKEKNRIQKENEKGI